MKAGVPTRSAAGAIHWPRVFDRLTLACLLVLTVWAPLAVGGVLPASLLGIRLLTLGGLTAWLLAGLLGGHLRTPPLALLVTGGGYLAATGASAALSAYSYGSWRTAADSATFAAAFLLAAGTLTSARRRRLWLGCLLAVAALLGVYGLLQAGGLGWTPRQAPERVSSLYYNSNHYAGFLALTTPLVLGLALNGGRRAWGWAALCALLLVNFVLTFSWALLPVLAVGGLLALWRWRTWGRTAGALPRGGVLVALVLGGLVLALNFAPQLRGTSLADRWQDLTATWVRQSLDARQLIWRGAWQEAHERPLLGVGPGNFASAYTAHRSPHHLTFAQAISHADVNYAHSDYLQVASETGFVGLGFFMAFWLLVLVWRRPRAGSWAPGLVAGLGALLLYGLVDGNLTVIPANALLAYACAGALHARGDACC